MKETSELTVKSKNGVSRFPYLGQMASMAVFSVWPLPEIGVPLWEVCLNAPGADGRCDASAAAGVPSEWLPAEEIWWMALQLQKLLCCGWGGGIGGKAIVSDLLSEVTELVAVLGGAVQREEGVRLAVEPCATIPARLSQWLERDSAHSAVLINQALTSRQAGTEYWNLETSSVESPLPTTWDPVPPIDLFDDRIRVEVVAGRELFDRILASRGRRGWNTYSYLLCLSALPLIALRQSCLSSISAGRTSRG
jgi:hypothetical protein